MSEKQEDIDKLIEEDDLKRAKLRQKMTFFRSLHVVGDRTRLDDDIDQAIERCLHEAPLSIYSDYSGEDDTWLSAGRTAIESDRIP